MNLSEKERVVIVDALTNYRDEKNLDRLQTDSKGNYIDSDFPKDAETANIVFGLLDRLL